jgi:hypothetical protein
VSPPFSPPTGVAGRAPFDPNLRGTPGNTGRDAPALPPSLLGTRPSQTGEPARWGNGGDRPGLGQLQITWVTATTGTATLAIRTNSLLSDLLRERIIHPLKVGTLHTAHHTVHAAGCTLDPDPDPEGDAGPFPNPNAQFLVKDTVCAH